MVRTREAGKWASCELSPADLRKSNGFDGRIAVWYLKKKKNERSYSWEKIASHDMFTLYNINVVFNAAWKRKRSFLEWLKNGTGRDWKAIICKFWKIRNRNVRAVKVARIACGTGPGPARANLCDGGPPRTRARNIQLIIAFNKQSWCWSIFWFGTRLPLLVVSRPNF